ncbi:colicin immunity domain-containing protein [Pseudomonas entomophila]|uniref:Colicin D immunity protein domain-containing protein n=2 Tax=Pseudomonas entomophila TaxID=312306 RepID=Q1I936_PSEE4|nr:colicin immunity domain-containing protein [Pseudomonas entomophila]WMW03427.1 colicin immunity domain-containing protein [Pseudomonas entomophila]CAK15842.1 conserved hypothetical protein [Pseudomonas entomophila L48]
MSLTLLEFARSFIHDRLSATVFSEAYMELWKIERDNQTLLGDASALSECLSSIFCAADMYCEDVDLREDYEYDQEQLKREVERLMEELNSTTTDNH